MDCSSRQLVAQPSTRQRSAVTSRGPLWGPTALGALTITESETGVSLTFDVPGFSADDISLELKDGRLVVSGDRTSEASSGKSLYSDRPERRLRRVVRLDRRLDPATIDAELQDGVLTVCLSRRAECEPRTINIRHAGQEH